MKSTTKVSVPIQIMRKQYLHNIDKVYSNLKICFDMVSPFSLKTYDFAASSNRFNLKNLLTPERHFGKSVSI